MEINENLHVAEEVGVVKERLELGYRMYVARGPLIGSQLPTDCVAGLISSRVKSVPQAFADDTGLLGCAFPTS